MSSWPGEHTIQARGGQKEEVKNCFPCITEEKKIETEKVAA